MKMRQIISENTGISISVVISLLGGIFWLSTLYAKTVATEQSINRIELNQQEYYKNLTEINNRLGRIEGYLRKNDEN